MNTREKAIGLLWVIGKENYEPLSIRQTSGSFYNDVREVAQAYLDQQWIPVSERLPEIDDPVIACRRMGDEYWFGCCIYREFGFPWVELGKTGNVVTHWMPLPPPPESE